ncbi:MAG: hypothetical protein RMK29_10865 [Myxococcales bacterium]|nr:hypothetical protein [Myxococcota bacterium]MDW8282206.1 hypothetical protein [Myxococcales bacterium]
MSKEDRPRRSWRDIDRARDGAAGMRAAGPTREREEERAQKQYRAALEEAFERGELGKLAEKLASPPIRLAAEPQPAAEVTPPPEPPAPPPPVRRKADDRATLRKKVLEAVGRHDITRAVERYLERFPMPDDHEFLEQVLEHEQEGRVMEAIRHIDALLDERVLPRRSRALCGKLRYLAETSPSDPLREMAERLLRRLG